MSEPTEQTMYGVGWGSIRIECRIMTDAQLVLWKVPISVDGVPTQYLEKYEGSRDGTYINVGHQKVP